jgi:pilus assembly protein CpaE
MKRIKVILADHNENTRNTIRQMLEIDRSIDVVDEAADTKELLDKVKMTEPEIVIIDVSMPEINGMEAAHQISLQYPQVSVILISINDQPHNFKQAMLAGAKEYLIKPFSPDEINSAVKQVARLNRKRKKQADSGAEIKINEPPQARSKIISVFGTKGGVGKSIICTNLAVACAQKYKNKVGIVDLDIQFGDISILMNVNPRRTISEFMQEGDEAGKDLLEDYIYERNGVNILAAPNKPELAELVTADGVKNILDLCREINYYTFIDTPSYIDDITLNALEMSDMVLLIIALDLPTIKNVKKGIDVLRSLQFLSKTRLILNRSSGVAGIEARDVEKILDMKIRAEVPSDGKLVLSSVNRGIPFIKMNPKAPVSKGIMKVLEIVD